jgi:hypothetical protein
MTNLTEDDKKYHTKLMTDALLLQGAQISWSNHLASKYSLKQGDIISNEGEIIRVQTGEKKE